MIPQFQNYLLKLLDATSCTELSVIQSLWSGYGKISRYGLEGAALKTVVVKFINLNQTDTHPRGWNTNLSHQRKVKSYEIETYWYKNYSALCSAQCRIPKFIGAFAEGKDQWIIMEDLNDQYPLRKYQLVMQEVKGCLRWLANFHATFLCKRPAGLWEVGTYWHLATRPDEWKEMKTSELKSKAQTIDMILNNCRYQTIVHGDAKLANFCFSEDGKEIAAVDFQYVGGGCGMKDVAYFLGSCLSSSELEEHEKELLDFYFKELWKGLHETEFHDTFKDLEEEWRRMYPIACTDFTRFLLGWMPTHQKINSYNHNKVMEVLSNL